MVNMAGYKDMVIGSRVIEPGNSEEFHTGDWRSTVPIIDQSLCIDCMTCIISIMRRIWKNCRNRSNIFLSLPEEKGRTADKRPSISICSPTETSKKGIAAFNTCTLRVLCIRLSHSIISVPAFKQAHSIPAIHSGQVFHYMRGKEKVYNDYEYFNRSGVIPVSTLSRKRSARYFAMGRF